MGAPGAEEVAPLTDTATTAALSAQEDQHTGEQAFDNAERYAAAKARYRPPNASVRIPAPMALTILAAGGGRSSTSSTDWPRR